MGLIINKLASTGKSAFVGLQDKTALVVDDFHNFRAVVRGMLLSFGITRIDEATNGETAIGKLIDNKYDIILCDYNLGQGKDGQQVLEEAKHRGLIGSSTIFIMITAENTSAMVLGAVEYLPDDYLVKPFTQDVLISRLGKLMQKKSEFAGIQRALDRKQYEEVILLCDQSIQMNPSNAYDFLKVKAEVLITMGQYDQANELYCDILKSRTILWALMGTGKILYMQEKYDEARDVFQDVLNRSRMHMEAYDWLAKTYDQLNQPLEVQRTLAAATELSPKVVVRQRALGEVAYRNSDFDVAKRSFRSAITVGKNSYLKSPSEYMGLAKVLVDTNASGEALQVVGETKKEFRGNPAAMAQSSAVEGMAYRALGDGDRAAQAIEEGARYYADAEGLVSPQVAMDLAKAYFTIGATDKGKQIMQDVVKNNHEDERMMRSVQEVFRDANMQAEGAKLIQTATREVIELNNRGAALVREGKLEEAIAYFEQAVAAMPGNKTVLTNTAYSMILYMQQGVKNSEMLRRTYAYLERARTIDPHHKNYLRLVPMFQRLMREGA